MNLDCDTMFRIIAFSLFFIVYQALIFGEVKLIDFNKKSQMVYSRGLGDTDIAALKKYNGDKIELKKVVLDKKEFSNDVGIRLKNREAAIKGPIDFESGRSMGLINKYQFRRDLHEKPQVPVVRVGRD